MDLYTILFNLISLIVPVGAGVAWLWSRLDKKFDAIDKRFDQIDQRFAQIDQKFEAVLVEIKEIRIDIHKIDIRLSKLEAQDEERFRNEIKLIISRKDVKEN